MKMRLFFVLTAAIKNTCVAVLVRHPATQFVNFALDIISLAESYSYLQQYHAVLQNVLHKRPEDVQ